MNGTQEDKTKYVTISTKISQSAFTTLRTISTRGGFTIYNLFQVIIEAFLKTSSSDEYWNEYVREAVRNFVEFQRARDGFALCDDNTSGKLYANESVVFVKKNDKPLPEAVLVKKDEKGGFIMKRQEDEILTAFLQAFSPSLLAALEKIQKEQKRGTLTSTLKEAVAEMTPERDLIADEVRELFSETRIHNGVNFDEIQQDKRHCFRSFEKIVQDATPDASRFVSLEEVTNDFEE